jgi:hypothetical protein
VTASADVRPPRPDGACRRGAALSTGCSRASSRRSDVRIAGAGSRQPDPSRPAGSDRPRRTAAKRPQRASQRPRGACRTAEASYVSSGGA